MIDAPPDGSWSKVSKMERKKKRDKFDDSSNARVPGFVAKPSQSRPKGKGKGSLPENEQTRINQQFGVITIEEDGKSRPKSPELSKGVKAEKGKGSRVETSLRSPPKPKPKAEPKAAPDRPELKELVANLLPILQCFGYDREQVATVVKMCNYDSALIEQHVSRLMDGHSAGNCWSTIAAAGPSKRGVKAQNNPPVIEALVTPGVPDSSWPTIRSPRESSPVPSEAEEESSPSEELAKVEEQPYVFDTAQEHCKWADVSVEHEEEEAQAEWPPAPEADGWEQPPEQYEEQPRTWGAGDEWKNWREEPTELEKPAAPKSNHAEEVTKEEERWGWTGAKETSPVKLTTHVSDWSSVPQHDLTKFIFPSAVRAAENYRRWNMGLPPLPEVLPVEEVASETERSVEPAFTEKAKEPTLEVASEKPFNAYEEKHAEKEKESHERPKVESDDQKYGMNMPYPPHAINSSGFGQPGATTGSGMNMTGGAPNTMGMSNSGPCMGMGALGAPHDFSAFMQPFHQYSYNTNQGYGGANFSQYMPPPSFGMFGSGGGKAGSPPYGNSRYDESELNQFSQSGNKTSSQPNFNAGKGGSGSSQPDFNAGKGAVPGGTGSFFDKVARGNGQSNNFMGQGPGGRGMDMSFGNFQGGNFNLPNFPPMGAFGFQSSPGTNPGFQFGAPSGSAPFSGTSTQYGGFPPSYQGGGFSSENRAGFGNGPHHGGHSQNGPAQGNAHGNQNQGFCRPPWN